MTTDTGAHFGATSPPPPSKGPKRLVRRPDAGPIGGVCAGVAEYFDVDPTIVRIAAVVLAFTGPGIPAYVIAWIFLPAGDSPSIAASAGTPGRRWDRSTQAIGIILMVIALSVLWGDWWSPAPRWMIPIGLIALGAWLLLRRDRDEPAPPGPAGDPRPWSAPTGPIAGTLAPTSVDETGSKTTSTDPTTESSDGGATGDEEGSDATATAVAPSWGEDGEGPPDQPPWSTEPGAPPPPPAPTTRRRRLLGPIVFGALLVWGGVAWLAEVDVEDALAIGLCILGLGFVLGAFIGGSWALVIPAVLVGGALVAATVVDIPLGGGIGNKTWTVATVVELDDAYEVGIGKATLDLSQLDLDAGEDLEVVASVGIGELVILLPDDVAFEIDAEIGAGDADVLGVHDEGVNVDVDRSFAGDPDLGTLHFDLQVGLGHIEVSEGSRDPRQLERLPR